MRILILILSLFGLVFTKMEAVSNNLQWGFGLRNFDLSTLSSMLFFSVISFIILLIFKAKNKIFNSIIIGSLYGIYKAINLYSLGSGGLLGKVAIFTANHTLTITFGIMLIAVIINMVISKKSSNQKK